MKTMREYEKGTGRSRHYATINIKDLPTGEDWNKTQIKRMIDEATTRTPQYKNYVLLNEWTPEEYHLTEAGLLIFRGILEGFIEPEQLDNLTQLLTVRNAGELLKNDRLKVERLNDFIRYAIKRRLNGLQTMF